MKSVWGFSRQPSAIMALAPLPVSSPGWKRIFTAPFSSSLRFISRDAAPSAMAVCASWPQACMQPFFEA